MRFKAIVIPFIFGVMMSGCSSSSVGSLELSNNELLEKERRMECLKRYEIALQECRDFVSPVRNPALKDRQMIQCMSIKGFPNGLSDCK